MNDNRKNILIICPVFHGYEKRIFSCIQHSMKYKHLYFIKDAPLISEKYFLILKNIFPKFGSGLLKRANKRILKCVRNNNIDTLFIVKGRYVSDSTVSLIQKEYPTIRMVLYEWDSISNNPNALKLLGIIRESYTFDFEDAQKFKGYNYHPLFYSFDQLPVPPKETKNIDFLFVGGFSLERMPLFIKIKTLCEEEGWNFTFHLFVPYSVYVKYKSIMHPYKRFISFKSLNYERYYSLIRKTKAVVDIVNSDQTGLTIRSIEALSQYCHLITTNRRIVEMNFYTESNITIVESDNIGKDVLKKALETNFNRAYNKTIYSTKEWLEIMDII